jgi:hypothetical protein
MDPGFSLCRDNGFPVQINNITDRFTSVPCDVTFEAGDTFGILVSGDPTGTPVAAFWSLLASPVV